MSKTTRILVTIFLGPFGVHKFMDGKPGMGLLYLFTFGLFGIGWLVDVIAAFADAGAGGYSSPQSSRCLMSQDDINMIHQGGLPRLNVGSINLMENEQCCYADYAYTYVDKTETVGYERSGSGVNVRIAKGVSVHSGGGNSHAVKQTTRTTYSGILYITSERVVYSSTQKPFDASFSKISSVMQTSEGIVIQIGSRSYELVLKTKNEFLQVYNQLKNL